MFRILASLVVIACIVGAWLISSAPSADSVQGAETVSQQPQQGSMPPSAGAGSSKSYNF